uniref:Cell division protein n=1 Tax=Trebouxia lynnae TaxID=1825957 RepID=A0A6B9VP07_9CHLO|nr:cell division protein [Trebouxia lynnae]QHO63936.1 cell division protein [Trebouxia lynnae]
MLENSISISLNFINALETEYISLKKKRLEYDPKKNFFKIQKAFQKRNNTELITESAFFLINCSIFYFLPFWIIYFLTLFFSHFGNKNGFFVQSVFVSNYRIRTRTSITTNCKQLNNIQFVIALFPFIFTFSFLIRSRYKKQLFSYLMKDTLPGISLSHQNLSWETFREITCQKVFCFSLGDRFFSNPVFVKRGINNSNISTQKHNYKLEGQDFIERLDISSNLILLEMKPVWEQQQKQFYIGFLPKKNQITLNEHFHRKQKLGKNEIVHISNLSLPLTKNTKNNKSENFSEHKFYGRKQNFLRFYKDKIDLKATLINKKPSLINVFSKQQFQQKLFDLDELPLKLVENYLEFFPNKSEENQESLIIPTPNLFETLQTFPNPRFTSDLLRFSSNRGITDENDNFNKPCNQIEDQNPVFDEDLLETFELDGEEYRFYKKLILENEVKKVFYTEGFFPCETQFGRKKLLVSLIEDFNTDSSFSNSVLSFFNTNVSTDLGTSEEETDLAEMAEKEKNREEFDLFDSIETLILNLEKNQQSLNLPEQSNYISSRLLSGYWFPDMEITNLRFSPIQEFYKNIIFQKQNKELLSMKIELPSSFLTNPSAFFDNISTPVGSHDPFLVSSQSDEEDVLEPYQNDVLTINQRQQNELVSSQSDEEDVLEPYQNDVLTINQRQQNGLVSSQSDEEDVLEPYQNDVLTINQRQQNGEVFFNFSQLKFHYLPTLQTLSNQKIIENLNSSGIYQRVTTIYKQEIGKNFLVLLKPFLYIQPFFRESWEPVTIQSWLVITKLSFAFIILKFFQNLLINYGKELVFLNFLDDSLKEDLGLIDKEKDKGYRLIKKVKKRFKDVAGIDNILPELGELVWVLRNSGRSFKVSRALPKGFLFVGPPGTGKTLLVQAIAGEAEVPVLVQSGSGLTDAGENEKGAQRLKKLFEQARKVTPCIVFIDEIDTLGESRQNVMSNHVGADDLIQSLHKSNQEFTEKSGSDFVNTDKPGNITEKKSRGYLTKNENLEHNSIGKKNQAKQQANQEQLNLLMQFLIELDGLKSRAGIIVIGATNRPKVLDPALTRPGRFDRVLNLEFPGKRKRIEILKLYSQNIGLDISSTTETKTKFFISTPKLSTSEGSPTEDQIILPDKRDGQEGLDNSFSDISNTNHVFGDLDFAWEYLANRTFGFSAADLAAAMNQSSIQAILQNTGHTIETIEQGIEFITTYSIEKPKIESTKEKDFSDKDKNPVFVSNSLNQIPKNPKFVSDLKSKDPFFITRLAYYQAGKAVLHTLLPQHPDAIVLKLWPQSKNSRHKNVNLELTSLNHRAKLETRLIGLYAGKAAELVALSLNYQTKKQTYYTRKITNKIKENKEPNRKKISVKTALKNQYVRKFTSPKQILTNQRIFSNFSPSSSFITFADTKQKNQQIHNFSQYNKRNLSHSTLGIEDLSVASNLAHSLVEKWHFYSNKIAIRRENQIFTNQNQFEISEIEVFDLFQQLTEDVQNRISASNISESDVREGRDKHSLNNFQEWSIRPWWQNQITEQTANLNMFYDDWSRIYLSDPEESERNEEWVAPDEYYHNTQNLKNLLRSSSFHALHRKNFYLLPTFKNLTNPKFPGKIISELTNNFPKEKNQAFDKEFFEKNAQDRLFSNKVFEKPLYVRSNFAVRSKKGHQALKSMILKGIKYQKGNNNCQIKNKLDLDLTWNDLYKLDRDYIYHALILTCFNKAFSLLDENRELLDYLADYLMRFETLRQHKIKQIFHDFGHYLPLNKPLTKTSTVRQNSEFNFFKKDKQKINFIFDKNWGKNSRRSFSRFFSFDQ